MSSIPFSTVFIFSYVQCAEITVAYAMTQETQYDNCFDSDASKVVISKSEVQITLKQTNFCGFLFQTSQLTKIHSIMLLINGIEFDIDKTQFLQKLEDAASENSYQTFQYSIESNFSDILQNPFLEISLNIIRSDFDSIYIIYNISNIQVLGLQPVGDAKIELIDRQTALLVHDSFNFYVVIASNDEDLLKEQLSIQQYDWYLFRLTIKLGEEELSFLSTHDGDFDFSTQIISLSCEFDCQEKNFFCSKLLDDENFYSATNSLDIVFYKADEPVLFERYALNNKKYAVSPQYAFISKNQLCVQFDTLQIAKYALNESVSVEIEQRYWDYQQQQISAKYELLLNNTALQCFYNKSFAASNARDSLIFINMKQDDVSDFVVVALQRKQSYQAMRAVVFSISSVFLLIALIYTLYGIIDGFATITRRNGNEKSKQQNTQFNKNTAQ